MIESAKWQAWSQLQDMAPVEAMRLYVRLLEDELVSHHDCAGLLYPAEPLQPQRCSWTLPSLTFAFRRILTCGIICIAVLAC